MSTKAPYKSLVRSWQQSPKLPNEKCFLKSNPVPKVKMFMLEHNAVIEFETLARKVVSAWFLRSPKLFGALARGVIIRERGPL